MAFKFPNPFRKQPSAAARTLNVSEGDWQNLLYQVEEMEISEAGLSRQLLDFAFEDLGWTALGAAGGGLDMPQAVRHEVVQRARSFAIRDPLATHSVRLWRIFTVGDGITFKAKDESVQEILDDFVNDPRNRSVMSFQGQQRNADKLMVDGEIAFIFFQNTNSTTIRRLNDPLQITEIVKKPGDMNEIVGYKREFSTGSGQTKKIFYWDIFFPEEDRDGSLIPEGFKAESAPMYFVTTNTLGERGNSQLIASLDWSKSFRKFMEARHAIQIALSKFVLTHDVKGGTAAVQAVMRKYRSGLATGGSGNLDNPPDAPGSVFVQGTGHNLSAIKPETGAAAAQTDGNMLIQMAGLGPGIPPNQFGAGNATKFSEATTMQLPMLRMLKSNQRLWASIYTDIFNFVLEASNIDKKRRAIDIGFPPIDKADAKTVMESIEKAVAAVPEFAQTDEIRTLILNTLGVNDPSDVIEKLNEITQEPPQAADKKEARIVAAKALESLALAEAG